MILVLGPKTHATIAAVSQTPLFPGLLRHTQSLPPPQPMHTFAIDPPTLTPEQRRHPPITITRMRPHQLQKPPLQALFFLLWCWIVTLRSPRLVEHPARASLAYAELPLNQSDCLTPACRARQFPRSASLRIALSSSASASSFLSRRFSSSNSLSLLASWAFMPPY